jgi:hypothetical protein
MAATSSSRVASRAFRLERAWASPAAAVATDVLSPPSSESSAARCRAKGGGVRGWEGGGGGEGAHLGFVEDVGVDALLLLLARVVLALSLGELRGARLQLSLGGGDGIRVRGLRVLDRGALEEQLLCELGGAFGRVRPRRLASGDVQGLRLRGSHVGRRGIVEVAQLRLLLGCVGLGEGGGGLRLRQRFRLGEELGLLRLHVAPHGAPVDVLGQPALGA